MIASQHRPGGIRMLSGAGQKIKGMIIVPQPVNNALLWSSWPWTTWIKPQIDLAVSLGCNAIYMTSPAGQYLNASVPASQLASQLLQYLNYCQQVGLMSYDNCAIGANWPSIYGYQAIGQMWSWWLGAARPRHNEQGFQLVNEINAQNIGLTAQQAATMVDTLTTIARPLTSLPLSCSLTLNTKAMLSDAVAQAVSMRSDYIDYHPYLNLASSTPGEILPADIIPLRSNSWWRPFMIGESGQSVTAGSVRQFQTFDANKQISQMNDCLGVMSFSVSDYENTFQWGMYAPASTSVFAPQTARPQVASFNTWVGHP